MAKPRTDPHRPGAIIPAHYTATISFALPSSSGGFPVPGYAWDCTYDRRDMRLTEFGPVYSDKDGKALAMGEHGPGDSCCCRRYLDTHPDAERFGCPGKCGVCGAHYVEGVMFVHEPTGALVFMGHDCADKYEALFDASACELARERAKAALATCLTRAKNEKERAAFLAKHEGLEAALELASTDVGAPRGSSLLADLRARFVQWRTLSDKQVALALKVAGEIRNPPPKPVEPPKVPAPVTSERVIVEGTIVHTKWQESDYGGSLKMLVLVTTPEGAWKAWGTVPAGLDKPEAGYVGSPVRVKARVEVSPSDPSFAFLKRPTLA